jgi:hypothetical protein
MEGTPQNLCFIINTFITYSQALMRTDREIPPAYSLEKNSENRINHLSNMTLFTISATKPHALAHLLA